MKLLPTFFAVITLFFLVSCTFSPARKNEQVAREVSALNNLLGRAELHLEKGNYGSAGIAYRQVLEDYPENAAIQKKIKFNQAQVSEKIEICSAKMMEKGLLEYRGGNLQAAIKSWKKLVSFNPEYEGAKRSLNTAVKQMKSLQSLRSEENR